MADPASALTPPPGGDQSQGWQVLLVHAILLGIGIALLFARLYVRAIIVRKIGIDDYFIILGVISTTASMILAGWQIKWGFGRHMYYLLQTQESRDQLIQSNKISTILQFLTVFDLLFIKCSIGFFLLRAFGSKNSCRWTVWSIMSFVFLATMINAITLLAQCRPLHKVWNPAAPGKCWSPDVVIRVGYYNGATSVLSDWALASTPIVVLWNLQMSLKKKFGIAALMSLGYFTGATAVVRCVLLSNLTGNDVTWDAIPLAIWAGIETRLGIIGACIPAINPLFNRSKRVPFRGWSRIFDNKPTSLHSPVEGARSPNRIRVRNKDSISEALRSCDQDSRGKHGLEASVWSTNKDGSEILPQKTIVSEREIPLEDMDVRQNERSDDTSSSAYEERTYNLV